MHAWPRNPVIYEINTWVWLQQLSRQYGKTIQLGTIPPEEWDRIQSWNADAVWLMGVWQRSAAGIRLTATNDSYLLEIRQTIPDFTLGDMVGSPFCVCRYSVDPHLGEADGLASARSRLAERNIRLVLDYVPNHLAPDHPWVSEHPEYFIQGEEPDRKGDPSSFLEVDNRLFAYGRNAHRTVCADVLQLNVFHPGLRYAARNTLLDIASQCDGLHCEMAMLSLNEVFKKTWGSRVGPCPSADYWPEQISTVCTQYPGFIFMAEACQDTTERLHQQGFTYCYDKKLYVHFVRGEAAQVRHHLQADYAYQQKLIRFMESHNEMRAAAVFCREKNKTTAMSISTLPGAKLLHWGQREGRRIKLPLSLGHLPEEPLDPDLQFFYDKLTVALQSEAMQSGNWRLCEVEGWADNQSHSNLLAWCRWWEEDRYLMVINLAETRSQGMVLLPWRDLEDRLWNLFDLFSNTLFTRDGTEMTRMGLFAELDPWDFHLFRFYKLSPWSA